MPAVQLICISSASALAVLWLLFFVEDRREQRFFERLRSWLDRGVDRCIILWHSSLLYVGGGAVRVWLHYAFHQILRVARFFLTKLTVWVERLQRRNRRVVRSVQTIRSETHLAEINAHRQATALTPEEKQALKERSLEG